MSSARPRRHPRVIALALTIIGLAMLGQPAVSYAATPTTITVAPTTVQAGNCIPFGRGVVWPPYAGFVYKNLPAFQLRPGDILAFDTNDVNDADIQLDIALAATSANGNDHAILPFTTVVHNTQTPANPRGDTTVGDYELQFTAEAPFAFPGGGLIIRFSNPSASYATDATCTQNIVGASSADTSGFFVERFLLDADGEPPWENISFAFIGAFRLTLFPPSNAFSFGKLKRNRHNGTATLAVNVPGPGTLSLTGKGVKTQRGGGRASASKTVSAAGTVKLRVKAKGKTKTKLNRTGKAKVMVKVTYTPTGGEANSKAKRIKLVKRKR
jgi:hypothetical protein